MKIQLDHIYKAVSAVLGPWEALNKPAPTIVMEAMVWSLTTKTLVKGFFLVEGTR